MSTTEAIEPEYESELQRAEEANLEGIEGLGICKLVTDKDGSLVPDKDGNALIIVTPSLVPKTGDSWERSFQLYLRETKEVCLKTNQILNYTNELFLFVLIIVKYI